MPNELIHETSPYLLQHAENPVEWEAWSDAVFERAKREDKLVFLSVGYSTCHWCHVMERESFEVERVAEVMNHHFINVKVDREERPDVDAVYMSYVQATTGQGGWPMSVWLTPEGKAVFGGTYFPPDDRGGRPGFVRVCHELARLWRDDRGRMEESAEQVMAHLRKSDEAPKGDAAVERCVELLLEESRGIFDTEFAGFGRAPKFPRPVVLKALMQMMDRSGLDSEAGKSVWAMVDATLHAMAVGGMHDQLGGGFHRYSVDRYWHVPHYEKMLYDQAQLAEVYLDGWLISGDEVFRETVEGICEYMLDEMRDVCGAFHAAEDADSLPVEGAVTKQEGAFWTWTAEEIQRVLSPQDALLVCRAYGVEADGNARPESDPHGDLDGRNTLFRAVEVGELAVMFDLTPDEIKERLEESRKILLERRALRPKPHRDDKIITAWNGLAMGAFARCGRAMGRPEWIEAAVRAADFVKRELWDGEWLYRSYRGKRGSVAGFPQDYAYLIAGLMELHPVNPEGEWLDWAAVLQRSLDAEWWDEGRGGYVMRPSVAGETVMVVKDDYDGAEPAANHVSILNLLRLEALGVGSGGEEKIDHMLRECGARAAEHPFGMPLCVAAMDLRERGVVKIQFPERGLENAPKIFHPRAVWERWAGDFIAVCEDGVCRRWEQ